MNIKIWVGLFLIPMSCIWASYDEDGKLELDPSWKCTLENKLLPLKEYSLSRSDGRSGKLICQKQDGIPSFQAALKNGQLLFEKVFNFDGKIEKETVYHADGTVLKIIYDTNTGKKQTERTYNSKEENHGPSKFYYPNGKLEIEESYSSGDLEGVKRSYDEEGRLKEVSWNKKGNTLLTYWPDPISSKILRIECEKDQDSSYPEHQKYCGFPNQSQIFELYQSRNNKLQLEKKIAFTRGSISYEENWSEGKLTSKTELSEKKMTNWLYDENGNIKELSVKLPHKDSSLMTLTYEGGKLSRLDCGKEGYRKEDREACGFDKEIEVSLYQFLPGTDKLEVYSTITMKNGKPLKVVENIGKNKRETVSSAQLVRETYPDGKLKLEKKCDNGVCYERRMFPDGKLSLELRTDKLGMDYKEYYQSGKVKYSVVSRVSAGVKSVMEERFDEQGRPAYSGKKIVKNDFTESGMNVGIHKRYNDGKIFIETTYDSKGSLTKKLGFDNLGEPMVEELYTDGVLSERTEFKKGMRQETKKFYPDGSIAN